MAKTLLSSVNEIFKRAGEIAGDAAALTSLTDSARQHPIDVAVQVINEGLDDLYSYAGIGMPGQQAESTITLVTGTQDYALATDLVSLHFPLIDKTDSQIIDEFPGGYDRMLLADLEQDDTGLPYYAAINPVSQKLHMDRNPTATENGRIYTYQYEKNLALSLATDTVPFTDTVFRAMVVVWTQLYKRDMKGSFDADAYKMSVGRASRFLSQKEPKQTYNPRTARQGWTVFTP